MIYKLTDVVKIPLNMLTIMKLRKVEVARARERNNDANNGSANTNLSLENVKSKPFSITRRMTTDVEMYEGLKSTVGVTPSMGSAQPQTNTNLSSMNVDSNGASSANESDGDAYVGGAKSAELEYAEWAIAIAIQTEKLSLSIIRLLILEFGITWNIK